MGLELGLNALGGRDYLGRSRVEAGLEGNVVFSDRRRGLQPLAAVGLSLAAAHVDERASNASGTSVGPTSVVPWYVGTHVAFGVGIPLAERTVLQFELMPFVRWRVDGAQDTHPEFYDPLTARTSNTALGIAVRAAGIFWQ